MCDDNQKSEYLELEKEINEIKKNLTPEELAKKIDSTYLSINNIRLLLQIFSVIMTIFLAGAVAFGLFGLKNVFSIYEIEKAVNQSREMSQTNLDKAEEISKKTENELNTNLQKIKDREIEFQKEIEEFKKQLNHDIDSMLNVLNDEFKTTKIDLLNKSSDLNIKIKKTSANVSKIGDDLKTQIIKMKDEYNTEMENLVKITQESKKLLEEHQKRIAEVELMFKSFYEQMTTEIISTDQKNKMFIIGKDDGPLCKEGKECTIWVVFILKETPIKQTVKLRYHIYSQPYMSFGTYKNVIVFRWGQDEKSLSKKAFYVDYVKDPTVKSGNAKIETHENGDLYIDGIIINPGNARNLYIKTIGQLIKNDQQ